MHIGQTALGLAATLAGNIEIHFRTGRCHGIHQEVYRFQVGGMGAANKERLFAVIPLAAFPQLLIEGDINSVGRHMNVCNVHIIGLCESSPLFLRGGEDHIALLNQGLLRTSDDGKILFGTGAAPHLFQQIALEVMTVVNSWLIVQTKV